MFLSSYLQAVACYQLSTKLQFDVIYVEHTIWE